MRSIQYILFLALMVMAHGLWAQEDFRKKAPGAGVARPIEIGQYQSFTLKNGLTVIVVENHKLPRVSFQVTLDLPLFVEKEKTGAAEFAGDLLATGTKTRTKSQIDESIDFIGASMGSSFTGIFGASLTKHQDKLLTVMSDVLLNPAFSEEEFEKYKRQYLSNLASNKDDPNAISGNVTQVLRYGKNHPYGEITTEETVNNITLADCKAYYDTYFKPNIAYLVIVGDITAANAKKLAEQYFGAWKKGEVAKTDFPAPALPETTQVDFVNKTGAVQSVVNITYPVSLKTGDSDGMAALVMNAILGSGSSGRLYKNIREDKGYTYGAYSNLSPDQYVGSFSASASVRNEVTDSSLTQFLLEMDRIRTEKIGPDELSQAKNVLAGSFARRMESPQTVAGFALNTFRYKLPKDYYNTYLKRLDAVTADDVMAAAKKYIRPDRAHIVVVGNKDEVAEKLIPFSKKGELNYYDTYGNPVDMKGSAVPTDLTAADVVENYLNAIGGREKLAAVKDMKLKAGSTVQGMQMQMNITQKAPNKMHMAVNMSGMTLNEAKFDGEKGYQAQMGQSMPVGEAELNALRDQATMFPETNYTKDGYKLELKGAEPIEGSQAYRVDVTTPDGKTKTEYYDTKTGFKIREIQKSPEGVVTNDWADYREVEGLKFPFKMTITGMAPFPIVFDVEAVELNKGVDDALFKVE